MVIFVFPRPYHYLHYWRYVNLCGRDLNVELSDAAAKRQEAIRVRAFQVAVEAVFVLNSKVKNGSDRTH